ncbi:hypothetical protein JOC76_003599 [Neobacillus cucumis]|nr:hypothetical protein [Neobacillus cucumis]
MTTTLKKDILKKSINYYFKRRLDLRGMDDGKYFDHIWKCKIHHNS